MVFAITSDAVDWNRRWSPGCVTHRCTAGCGADRAAVDAEPFGPGLGGAVTRVCRRRRTAPVVPLQCTAVPCSGGQCQTGSEAQKQGQARPAGRHRSDTQHDAQGDTEALLEGSLQARTDRLRAHKRPIHPVAEAAKPKLPSNPPDSTSDSPTGRHRTGQEMELNQAQDSTTAGQPTKDTPPASPVVGTMTDVAAQVSYPHWRAVPWTLASKAALAKADLPREPGSPVRAWVTGTGWNDKDIDIALYSVADSVPTNASAKQLLAARRRSTAVRVCDDCGARTQQPLTESSEGTHRCLMCRRIARIRDFQAELRAERSELAQWAQQLLADPLLAVVWVGVVEAEPTAAGRRRPPLAARVQAVDGTGARLLDILVKLTGPRTKGAPTEAVPAEQGATALQQALAGRRMVGWDNEALVPVLERLDTLGCRVHLDGIGPKTWEQAHYGRRYPPVAATADRVARWRGDLDPATGKLLTPWAPGTADRLWLLLTDIGGR